jgi:Flp pilus assembly pilin Flp
VAGVCTSEMQQFELSTSSALVSSPDRADRSKGGVTDMTFSQWFEFAKANYRKEEGQTMAEYGVVLAVITIGIVATLVALSGGINGALNRVIGFL